jgi:hypothetical protein
MSLENIVYVVHCIDTEGPLNETLEATFQRLTAQFGVVLEPTASNLIKIQNLELDLGGNEIAIAECFSPELLSYNRNWQDIERMLDQLLSEKFRQRVPDSYGNGWVYSWHCMDHMGFKENPRQKQYGYGEIFNYYYSKIRQGKVNNDEINWHFHPLSIKRKSTDAATSYLNNYDILLEILCRRILENEWFPTVNRPGFHSERPDSHGFLEQWIPYDYANQFCEMDQNQPDTGLGRFGDWRRSPKTWRGYHPSHDDYQIPGDCRRVIFRCLNIGTRMRLLSQTNVLEAFSEASKFSNSILAFANHDWRNMIKDIELIQEYLKMAGKKFPKIRIKYAGAEEAAVALHGNKNSPALKFQVRLEVNRLYVQVLSGRMFGPQPFLAIQCKNGCYHHDNFDIISPNSIWTYIFDDQTIPITEIAKIGVASAGFYGGFDVVNLDLNN